MRAPRPRGPTRAWAFAAAGIACTAAVFAAPPGAPGSASANAPAGVAVLLSGQPDNPPGFQFLHGFRAALRDRQSIAGPALYAEFLDFGRFGGDPTYEEALRSWLARKYARTRVDLVVAFGPAALRFVLAERDSLWPGRAVLFGGVPEQAWRGLGQPAGVTGTFLQSDAAGTLRLARALLPGTRRVALVGGASDADRAWLDTERAQLAAAHPDVAVVDLVGLSWEETLRRIASLPPDSVVIRSSFVVDALGRSFDPLQVGRAIAESAHVPAFALTSAQLGLGFVGGYMIDHERSGHVTGDLAREILAGGEAARRPPAPDGATSPMVDARQLLRWNLDERRLPPGTIVAFPIPSLWRDYRKAVVAAALSLSVLVALVVVLLVERRRRHRAEFELRHRLSAIARLGRAATTGEMSAALAHQLGQPLGAITNNTEAALLLLDRKPPAITDAREAIAATRDDSQRANAVLAHVRALFRQRRIELQPIDVNRLVADTVHLAHTEAHARDVDIAATLGADVPAIEADPVNLQQVLLNLISNAIEALEGEPSGQRRVTVRTRGLGDAVEVSVADTGPGIPADVLPHLFDAFFTTKSAGLGMGLALAETVVTLHGGRIEATNAAGGGAVVTFVLPCRQARPEDAAPEA